MSATSEQPTSPAVNDERFEAYFHWGRRFAEQEEFDETERNYKLLIGERLVAARSALLEGDQAWLDRLRTAFGSPNNLTNWRFNKPFLNWCDENQQQAEQAVRILWDEDRKVSQRFNEFFDIVAEGVKPLGVSGVAFLHMAMSPTDYPIFRATPVSQAYKLTGYPDPYGGSKVDIGARYEHFLNFLDLFLERAAERGLQLRDRLDAQSITWLVTYPKFFPPDAPEEEREALAAYRTGLQPPVPEEKPDQAKPDHVCEDGDYDAPTFATIANQIRVAGLRLSERTLRRYHLSLLTRGFVILAGNSGTGKTWLAEAYADAVDAEHQLVSVAPNWTTNEDLLGYFNPVTQTYHDTSFSRFLRDAASAYHLAVTKNRTPRPYHLILDEMNLARVEYYFASFLSAMEVRARHGLATVDIGGGDQLELTPNLLVIGTVNIDETTHGFADKVWDRAQLVELDLPLEYMAAHLAGAPYRDDILRIWEVVWSTGPFAYRVVDDIATYVAAARQEGVSWEEAVDEQILQKILPKLKGTEPGVGIVLEELATLCEERYSLSHQRTKRMLEGFNRYGIASYFD